MGFRIFVGNLSHEAGEKDLRQAFSAFQGISDCRIILDRETGASRGFAFVEFQDEGEGRRAIQELDGADVLGRPIRLKEAQPQEGGGRGPGGPRPGPGSRPVDRGPRRFAEGEDRPPRAPRPARDGEDPAAGQPRTGDDGRERRQRPAPKDRRPEESRDRTARPHGRPPERERGGAHNRFVYEDEDEGDEDFELFEDEGDEDFDPSILERLEGVDYEPEDEESESGSESEPEAEDADEDRRA
ncbi:MAG: hypothetical protein R3F30_13725 [Planctomycetota bacterium]